MKTDEIGTNLKQLRNSKNMTQLDLAHKLGVTYQAISNWENGKNTPDLQTLIKISEIFQVSVDELLLQRDPYEGEYEPKHWAIRFLLYPILLFPMSFFISQFFLFANTVMSMVSLALFIDFVLMVMIGFIKIKNRKNFYLIGTLVLFVLVLAIILPFRYYFNLKELPYLRENNRVHSVYEFKDSFPQSLTFSSDDRDIVIMYNPGYPDIYWFDMEKDLEEMEAVISSASKTVFDVEIVGDFLYYTVYQTQDTEFVGGFELYRVDLNDFSSEFVLTDHSTPYKLLVKEDLLYLYNIKKTLEYEASSLYLLEDDSLTLVKGFDFNISDGYYINDRFVFSVLLSSIKYNVYTYDEFLEIQEQYFVNDSQDDFYLVKEENKLLTTYNDELVHLYDDIQYTGYMAEAEYIHNVGDLYYVDSGTLLSSNFEELSMHSFYQKNWREGDGQFVFRGNTSNKLICIDGDTLYQLEHVSRQVEHLWISNNIIRNILLFVSLPFISWIVTNGVRRVKRSKI